MCKQEEQSIDHHPLIQTVNRPLIQTVKFQLIVSPRTPHPEGNSKWGDVGGGEEGAFCALDKWAPS